MRRAAAWAVLLAALVSGCAAPQVAGLLEQLPPDLAASAEVAATPFYPQEDYQCGPASLAALLNHAGRDATPESLVPQVYLPARQGSLQPELLAATRRHALVAYVLEPRLEALLREIASGTPVLVLQNLALDWAPQWHYAVAIGYDLGARRIILRSGVTERLAMSLDTFERTWTRGGGWAMVALPPGRLPVTASERGFLSAVASLERLHPVAAEQAYEAALARWPGSALAALGLGNARYARHDLSGAAASYRRATQLAPASADAWNNLAQALSDLGRRDEALGAARQAVALGGPRLAAYRDTLAHIERAR
ncbi:MAG: PA2778 family cysteine peptidase [Betaproteobacteria bacterium]|nr:PA2778 family cysteine peptidase [Betaproteobacteria bacterium]MDH5349956.1 PA2778 family cysteine peptidase [Betaproteobacteria bacterium]